MATPGKRSEITLLMPGEEEGWRIWRVPAKGEALQTGNCAKPSKALLSAKSVLALPVREVFALPLWIESHQESLFRGVIIHQLERLGLAGRFGLVMDFSLVCREGERSLVLAAVLPSNFPDALCVDQLRSYDLSARMYPLPGDQWTFWLEEGRLVMAVTRGSELAYFQALGDRAFSPEVIQEMLCIGGQLETQGVISTPAGATLWCPASEAEKKALGEALGAPVVQQAKPLPRLSSNPWQLVPSKVQSLQIVKKEQWKRIRLGVAAAALYGLFIGLFGLQVGWLGWQKWRLQEEIKRVAPLVENILQTAENWKSLEGAVNPDLYPVEQLYQSSRVLPPEGVRFTLFEQEGNKLTITGEAKTAAAALKYMEDLKKNESFQSYHWQVPQPRLLPNGSAQFQIEGTRP